MVYEESEAYHIWAARKLYNVTVEASGEKYGIDINQGYFALQYGITEKWAADLNIGGTTVGWRTFSQGNSIESTTGLMDWSFGVRYQVYNELKQTNIPWMPTLTLRAGAVMPGSYDENFVFAPGPALRSRRARGAHAQAFRLARIRGLRGRPLSLEPHHDNDQYIVAIGVFQQIKGWELDLGLPAPADALGRRHHLQLQRPQQHRLSPGDSREQRCL